MHCIDTGIATDGVVSSVCVCVSVRHSSKPYENG